MAFITMSTPTPPIKTFPLDDWAWKNPPNWSNHPQGANYLAKLNPDPNVPGGAKRSFLPVLKARQAVVTRGLAPGDAFELGSTDVNDKKVVVKSRHYGVVITCSKIELVYKHVLTMGHALALSEEDIKTLPAEGGPVVFIQRQLRAIDEQIAQLDAQRIELIAQYTSVTDGTTEEKPDLDDFIKATTPATPGTPATAEPAEPGLPLHRLMLEPNSTRKATPAPRIAAVLKDDDDDEPLTPAQKAALSKLK